jgi:hypothetical protein
MDFIKETQKALEKVTNEKLPEMIEKNTEKMVSDIVESIFRWGDVKDSIKKKIEESINVNLQEFDLIDYNALIAKTINENLINQVNLQPILDLTQDTLGFIAKKEITLQEVANFFKSASMEENEQEGEGEFTFIVKENEEHGWVEVFADLEADKEEYKCCVRFILSTKRNREGKIFSFKTRDQYYDNNQKEISPSRLVNMDSIEAKIFRLYSAQVKITNYDNEISQYWDRY